jgi:pimeloyl-ACP methyl ester carboxylesterase
LGLILTSDMRDDAMTAAGLIPGAGGLGWYWHLVERDLQERGYDAFAVDLAAYGATGLPAYADAVVDAIDGRRDVMLVAQSMGAFTAPLVWQRVSTRSVVFVNAMIPQPGETPGELWRTSAQSTPGGPRRHATAIAQSSISARISCTTSRRTRHCNGGTGRHSAGREL